MKKKVIGLISVAIILSGAYMLFNNVFPLANQIDYPNEKDIISFSALYDNETIQLSNMSLGSILEYIKIAEPTRKMSVSENPYARPYFEIIVDTDDRQYKYFIYEENNIVYLEIPYYGIYIIDEDSLELLE